MACSSSTTSPALLLAEPATPFVEDFVGADRALKRLNVTDIATDDLDTPPVVMLDAPLSEARQKMDAEGIDYAIVLDANGHLHGWLGRRRADGDGSVADRARRMEAWVPADGSLKAAFSEMLLHDAGWVAVLDPGSHQYLGVLTPDSLYAAMRRSMGEEPESADDERSG